MSLIPLLWKGRSLIPNTRGLHYLFTTYPIQVPTFQLYLNQPPRIGMNTLYTRPRTWVMVAPFHRPQIWEVKSTSRCGLQWLVPVVPFPGHKGAWPTVKTLRGPSERRGALPWHSAVPPIEDARGTENTFVNTVAMILHPVKISKVREACFIFLSLRNKLSLHQITTIRTSSETPILARFATRCIVIRVPLTGISTRFTKS